MDFIERQASKWIAGDPTQSKIFDAAIDKVELAEKQRDRKILWGGICAIFVGAGYLSNLDGDLITWTANATTTVFDKIVSLGIGYSLSEFAFRVWRHARANKEVDVALSEVKASREAMVAGLTHMGGALSSEFGESGAEPKEARKIVERAKMAAKAINKIQENSKKGPKPR